MYIYIKIVVILKQTQQIYILSSIYIYKLNEISYIYNLKCLEFSYFYIS